MPSPPNGDYTSTIDGGLSSWSGSFTYNATATPQIVYTRSSNNQQYDADNTGQGDAINFSIGDGTTTVHFVTVSVNTHGGKAVYNGHANDNRDDDDHAEEPEEEDTWTASQT